MRGQVLRWVLLLAFSLPLLAQNNSSHTEFSHRLVLAALDRPNHTVRYDPAYVGIPYPGGDVPENTGACTDEIIRIYRVMGIDLQKEVHEDMVRNFSAYPPEVGTCYSYGYQH